MSVLERVADGVSAACLVVGALLSLAAGVGLVRFPDLLSRMHAVTKPQVLGLMLILVGAGLRLREWDDLTTLLLVGVFQLMTVPVSAQIVGRAAYRTGQFRAELLVVDELAEMPPTPVPEEASRFDEAPAVETRPDRGAASERGAAPGSGTADS